MLENCLVVADVWWYAKRHGTYVAASACVHHWRPRCQVLRTSPRRTFSPGFQKTSESGKSVLHSYETARPCARSCDLASELCGTPQRWEWNRTWMLGARQPRVRRSHPYQKLRREFDQLSFRTPNCSWISKVHWRPDSIKTWRQSTHFGKVE